jgi:hypothetical protein
MTKTLSNANASQRLTQELMGLDITKSPGRVAAGAALLEQIQEHDRQGERLLRQVADFLSGTSEHEDGRSLADRAEEVLINNGGPMRYREIAAEIRGRGFKHAHTPKNPNQLADSTWSAMYEDSRFVKVGRGIWDLASRQNGSSSGK